MTEYMKRYFNFLWVTLIASGLAFGISSCEQPNEEEGKKPSTENPDNNEDNKDNNGGNTGGSQTPDENTVEFPYVAAFPLEPGNMIAEGSDVGVTIEVTKVEHQNFVFELRPGAKVQSFKFDVYPLAQLYNNLLNDKTSGALTGSDAIDMAEHIRTYIFNTSGSGGYEISINDFDNPDDFLQIEYDWMSTSYAGASAIAIPDCDYVIAVVASTEPTASSATQEDITLCYVHTTSEELIGDPQVEIEVNAGYRMFGVQHYPNSDAAGIYFFGWLTEEIDAYIDTFGDTLFRDFIRTRVTAPSVYDVNVEGSCYYSVNYGQEADHNILSTTCAVAVDANLTPQEGYARSDFHLQEIPDDQKIVECKVDIIEDRVAAAYFEFEAEMPKDCNTIFYRVYTADQKAAWDNETELNRKKEAINLVQEGYGCHNPNFAWDKDAEKGSEAVGSSGKVKLEYYSDLQPGTTYYIGFTGRNGYGTPGPLTFSEPVTLDERNYTSPDACNVKELKLWLSDPGRTKFTQNITYDPSTVSMVHVQYMTADFNPGFWTDASWEQWIDFIFFPEKYWNEEEDYAPIVNQWATVPSGSDPFTWTGMTPDTEYTVFLCAEDFDGNISPMQFASIRTSEIQVGPDPTMKLSLVPYNGESYDWTVKYEIDHDVEYFLYCYTVGTAELSAFIPGLNQSHLNNIADSGISYEKWRDGIYNWVAGGFENNGGGMRADSDTSQDWEGNQTVVAACIAVGRDADGEPVYKMYHLICKDGNAQTLEEIFGITE